MAGSAVTVCMMACALMLTVCPPELSHAGENPADASDGRIIRKVEQDTNQDGRVDQIAHLDGSGNPVLLEIDTSGDGRFDTVQRFDDPQWSLVIEVHDDNGALRERRAYSDAVIRAREVFDPDTGRPTLVEKYDEKGRITLTREASKDGGPLDMTWHYDENEVAVAAERDTSGDGRFDIWYYYKDGRIDRVAEDRNGDGKPDLWETYDASGAIISSSEDLNLDGTPDLEKIY